MPATARTFFIAALAIAGIPPLAGFFSKDEILGKTFERFPALWMVGFLTAGMTAFYMFRLGNMTLFGKSRAAPDVAHHIHESPKTMPVPLMVLPMFSIVVGCLAWAAAI